MAAGVGQYPKSDGDVFFGQDANMAYYQATLTSTLNHASVNVTNSSTSIIAANASRKSLLVKNNGTAIVYIGFTSVSTSTGYPLQPGESIYLYTINAVLYGITAATTEDIRYLEVQ